MKKVSLLFLLLIGLCGCANNKSEKNTNVVDKNKYKEINTYYNVSYSFDKYMRCVVNYNHYTGNDESGWYLDYTKDWCVYLKGFYVKSNYGENYFAECKLSANNYDYYLIIY